MRAAAVIAVAMLALPVPAASAAVPGLNGKIAFTSDREGTLDVHVMNNDGTVPNRLTPYPSDDVLPAWSPNGQQIAFSSNRAAGNASDVFIINADGTGVRNLTPTTRSEDDPTWSPDGTRLAYTVDPGTGPLDIFTINADQSGETNITNDSFSDRMPAWSPDGTRIAYASGPRVFVINADGTGRSQLSTGPAGTTDDSPSWSPDGSRIAFLRWVDCPASCHSDIYVMSSDGTNPVNLTNSDSAETDPAWSPDGSKIAFAGYRNGNSEIYVMNALDGTGVTRLTVNPALDRSPDWQPLSLSGYPRPRSASPVKLSLVPSYATCTAPNRTHGPPLAFGSCNPPAQTSGPATVGTPDASGGGANFTGRLRLWAVPCAFNCFDGDIGIDLAIDDVRCGTAGARCGTTNASGPADYSGDLRFSFTFRLTDRFNATAPGGGTDAATVQDFAIEHAWACAQTESTSVGSTCDLITSLGAIVPSSVEDGKRQIWALDAVRVYDGGVDGDGDTTADNRVFARPGIFIP